MRVAVIGQGYVGAELGKAAHSAGHEVIGIEVNQAKLMEIANIGYRTTSNYQELSKSEIVVITVPTPLDEYRNPDLSFIEKACDSMARYLSKGTLIINESTSYPGTLREVIAGRLGNEFIYASAPERVDPGSAKWTINNTPRLLGALSDQALEKALIFYKSITEEVITVSSPEVAEAAKLFENTFRQVNIALVNEFAKISNSLGIPTYETLDAASTKPYGFMKFLPGLGVGGHCIPIDPTYLSFKAKQNGVNANFIDLANNVNSDMPVYVADKIDKLFHVSGKSVQLAGIAYKPNVADIRESPALVLADLLSQKGASVTWHDEFVKTYGGKHSLPISPVDIGIICVNHNGVNYDSWFQNNTEIIDLSPDLDLGISKFL